MFPAPFAYMFNLFSVLFVYLFDLFCCVQMLDYPCFLHLGPMQVGTQSVRLSYPTVSSISFFHIRGFLFPSLAVFHYLQRLVSAVSFIAVSFLFFFYLSLSFTAIYFSFFPCRTFLFLSSQSHIHISVTAIYFPFLHQLIFLFISLSSLSLSFAVVSSLSFTRSFFSFFNKCFFLFLP